MVILPEIALNQPLRLYRDLADWYPLLTPVGDYAPGAAFYRRLFEAHSKQPPRTLLDLGSGGHNAAHLKATLACTLIEVVHDRHVMGLFPRTVWLDLIAAAGFEPLAVPFEHSSCGNSGLEVFLGLRPGADARA
ncbi:MAG: hypothetical protein IT443_13400 [Phycisphaeraceae bacterium]|nr:hypothetical protein [Phycisphaeraceae bacterium]